MKQNTKKIIKVNRKLLFNSNKARHSMLATPTLFLNLKIH